MFWSQTYREIAVLDSNNHSEKYSKFDWVLAVDALTSIQTDFSTSFDALQQYQQVTNDWLFGYLTFDLKNNIEKLHSLNFDGLHFPDLFFFQPKKLFFISCNQVEMLYMNFCEDEIEKDFISICSINTDIKKDEVPINEIQIKQRISKEVYYKKVNEMLEHIQKGNIYEANLCMEFYAEQTTINPLDTFEKLNAISKAPFTVFFKNNLHFLLSASPERYLKKEKNKLISQPIKGTAKRYKDPIADFKSKEQLENNPKERSENIMITDLVRNDLSKTASRGSVKVEELCGIHTFNQVHQMISTITSKINPEIPLISTITTTFPMGSMTGAPKIAALQIIEDLEETKRGLYSGSFGYFTPDGDFDFNVVIRSILFNAATNYVSFSVGSAITSLSKPELEYEECLLKAKAMFQVLNNLD